MNLYFRLTLTFFILLVWVHNPVQAQKVTLKEADALFSQFQYALALPAYQKLLKDQKPTLYLTQRIAECYRQLNNSREAEQWYNRVIQFPDFKPDALRYAADAARKNGKYDRAKLLYEQFGQRVPAQASLATQLAAGCDSAQLWLLKPEPYELQKPENINSQNSDFSPVIYQNDLVFTSDRPQDKSKKVSGWTGNPYPKIYLAPKQNDGRFGSPVALGAPINNQYHNGSATLSADGQTLYFTRINQVKTEVKEGNTDPFSWVKFDKPKSIVNRLEIYIARKQGDNWGDPKPFAYNKTGSYSVGHPAISPDGNILYFVSDMPGGLGDTDIYYCTKQADGSWSKPVNAGKEINTAGKEVFPVVVATNKLYFSSEGHPGMGGLDIFSAEGKGATWKNVKNLKYPLNSSADDFGIVFDQTKEAGFLSSNRNSDNGTDDIYAFKLVRSPCLVAGRVIERVQQKKGEFTEKPVAGALLRFNLAGDTTARNIYSDAQGNFTFPVKTGLAYTLQANKEGYLVKTTDLTPDCPPEADQVKLSIVLDRNTINSTIILENIYYDFDKYDIRPEAKPELDKLVRILQDNPTIRIELGSHTDSRQTGEYNRKLSQLRADAAVNYIISQGIDPSRLTAKGYGETQLLNGCKDGVSCSELEHQINRRTEVKILSR
ncbi:OmpA family protein [Adhaeribacter radiodurans]|uniref:OmpA family protein n=1 Tax=Adhaeribacter radiodurans TaxID=2745197 RepID=A0A7L7LE05_9BACT|nr:OmpA family protein [Adhaeribacter radiodurans]QMU30649.1 OmpA family protein [Adhaeribacter radiodurans]